MNESATVTYACSDGGAGVTSCAGTTATGAALDTSTAGVRTISVTSLDAVGNQTVRTLTYIVSNNSTGPFAIAGTVTDRTGPTALLTGSTVRALQPGTSTVVSTTTVGALGNYSLSVPAGTYDIQVVPPNGSIYRNSIATSTAVQEDLALDFVLFTGSVTVGGNPGFNYTGKVVDSADNPVAGVTLAIGSSTSTTGQQGDFALVATSGGHTLTISGGPNNMSLQVPITITSDAYQQLKLPYKTLTVRLRDPGNNPVSGGTSSYAAPVSAFQFATGLTVSAGGSQSAASTSGGGGDAVMRILPTSGSTGNTVTFSSGAYQNTTFTLPVVNADTIVPVTVQPNTTQLTGTIRNSALQPLAGVTVAIGSTTSTTDGTGFFSLPTSNGSHTVSVRSSASGNRPAFDLSVPMTLSGSTNVILTLPFRQLTVHVRDAQNTSVPNAQVSYSAPVNSFSIGTGLTATASSSQSASATSGPTGDAVMLILPTAGSSGNPVSFASNSVYQPTTYAVPALSADTTVNVTVGTNNATYAGVVKDGGGALLSGVQVSIGSNTSTTDALGRFSVSTTMRPAWK